MNNKIIYLLRESPTDLKLFEKSIELLAKNFLPTNNYPIIVFHEGIKEQYFKKVSDTYSVKFELQEIQFSIPEHLDKSTIPEKIIVPGIKNPFSIGYRHMCRFYAGEMYKQDILKGTDYYLRLDNDSFFLSPVSYDIFKYMDNNDYVYGYHEIVDDNPIVFEGLWEKSEKYSLNKAIKKPFNQITYGKAYYTNFEIAKFNWFLEKDYMDYYNFIDLDGGIYKKRWGDHVIRYIGVNMFLDDKLKHSFSDLPYKHGNIFNY